MSIIAEVLGLITAIATCTAAFLRWRTVVAERAKSKQAEQQQPQK